MSFGFSVGDFIAVIQLAKTTYKNCVEAGPEYTEIAREIRSLHGVLKPLRAEAEKEPDEAGGGLFRQEPVAAQELLTAVDGCYHILEDLQTLLGRYEGLSSTTTTTGGEGVSASRKLWHRFRFSTKLEQLAAVRAKLISYTSTISVLLDAVQLRATGRVEDKLDNVSTQMAEGFESLKIAILGMAVKARAEQRAGSTLSLLSLSTYAGDDKNVWREFRRELVARGFRSKALDRHKDLLQAYMLKLDQCGVLDEIEEPASQNIVQSWWKKHAFVETAYSLPGLEPVREESVVAPEQPEPGTIPISPPAYTASDTKNAGKVPKPIPMVDKILSDAEVPQMSVVQIAKEVDIPKSKAENLYTTSNAFYPNIPWTTDSEESEKEVSNIARAQRARRKARRKIKSTLENTVSEPVDVVDESVVPANLEITLSDLRQPGENQSGSKLKLKAYGTQNLPEKVPESGPNAAVEKQYTQEGPAPNMLRLAVATATSEKVRKPQFGQQSRDSDDRTMVEQNIESEDMSSGVFRPPSDAESGQGLPAPNTVQPRTNLTSDQTKSDPFRAQAVVNQDEVSVASAYLQELLESNPDLDKAQIDAIETIIAKLTKEPQDLPQGTKSDRSPQGIQKSVLERAVLEKFVQRKDMQTLRNDSPEAPQAKQKGKTVQSANQRRYESSSRRAWGTTKQDLSSRDEPTETGRKAESSRRNDGSAARAQSPKAKTATTRDSPARPSFGRSNPDLVPRLKTRPKPEAHRRTTSIVDWGTNKGLSALSLALVGLGVVLRLGIRRSKASGPRSKDGYPSDTDYSYYTDSYSGTSDSSDSKSDSQPSLARKNNGRKDYKAGSQRHGGSEEDNPGRKSTFIENEVDQIIAQAEGSVSKGSLTTKAATTATSPNNAGVESSPESAIGDINSAAGKQPGPDTSTLRKHETSEEETGVESKKTTAGDKETITFMYTSDKKTGALERRFVMPDRQDLAGPSPKDGRA